MARSDAERNRVRILEEAERLFSERGVDAVSMDEIAAAAGVGKGTLYRRFGDRAGLIVALLDEDERQLQEAVIRGAPPLGPGAPPQERLVAFLRDLLALREQHLDLVVASETSSPGARFRSGAYAAWHAHAALLIRAARPAADADVLADVLLAPLAGDLYQHLRRSGITAHRIEASVLEVACEVLRGP